MSIFRASLLSILIASGVLLISCASTPAQSSSKSSPASLSTQDSFSLQAGQWLTVDRPVTNPVVLTTSAWSKVRFLSEVLDALKAHKDFTIDQKEELLKRLLDGLPLNAPDGIVRQVYFGKFFKNGGPLEIRVMVLTPHGEALQRNEKVILLLSNILMLKGKDGEPTPGRDVGIIVNFNSNASAFFGVHQGFLTNGQKASPEKGWDYDAAEKGSSIEKVMAAQSYLLDEDLSNDARAEKLVDSVISSPTELPGFRMVALLQKYQYRLSVEDLDGAREVWNTIIALVPSVPGDMTVEALEAMNGASLQLMERLKTTKATL